MAKLRTPTLPPLKVPAPLDPPTNRQHAIKAQRPAPARHPSIRPTGPRGLHLSAKPQVLGIGPGDPPPGFTSPTTSGTEWMVYWALWRLMHNPGDPRVDDLPYVGRHGDWGYQSAEMGGRLLALGSVSDFSVRLKAGQEIWIRCDTAYYHTAGSAAQQARDFYLKTHAEIGVKVVTVYDVDFVGDPTGKAVLQVTQEAIEGRERFNPILSGMARRAS